MDNANEKMTVAVVAEDSPPNLKVLVHLLQKLNFHVIACEDGEKAWQYISQAVQTEQQIDIIISDIMMPNMSGIELLKHVRTLEKYKDLPFFFITAVSDKEYISEAWAAKAQGYILKPVLMDRLFSKLKTFFPNIEKPQSK